MKMTVLAEGPDMFGAVYPEDSGVLLQAGKKMKPGSVDSGACHGDGPR